MKRPSQSEVRLEAEKSGLPRNEADKFFLFYSSKDWAVGKSPMKNWHCALAGWKLRWQERLPENRPPNGADRMIMQKEFERCVARMKSISDSYAEHQSWTAKDRAEFVRLKERKAELMKKLDIMI